MSSPEYLVYDFKKAGASDATAVAFKSWIEKASFVFAECWTELADGSVKLVADDIRTANFDATLKNVELGSVGCVVQFGDETCRGLWHLDPKGIRQIFAMMTNHPDDSDDGERPVSEIELVLAKLFFEYSARALSEAWPLQQPLEVSVVEMEETPKRSKLFGINELVTVTSMTLEFEDQPVEFNWILPKREITRILELIAIRRPASHSEIDPREVIERLPVEIVGTLGEVSISMKRLANLAVGDVVVLDQRIDRPIVALIDGKPYYECWPGKIGAKQGLEISACLRTD